MSANLQAVAQAVPSVKLLINGEFVESKTKEWKDVVNPATQQVLARVPFATPDELEAAVAAVIAEGKFRTYDMGGKTTTTEMAEAIAAKC